ncbi:hypothetical protein CVT24_008053 [Panaeolus cyanescens]|uniref:Uncharacterized protein n=1 Tax=Panaeolus cyanescens TaxID=181874 RepID=A0A409YQP9_9AGAR|nr:hypothetical protein CVT24_008053 [Panaeolus cyanescens]
MSGLPSYEQLFGELDWNTKLEAEIFATLQQTLTVQEGLHAFISAATAVEHGTSGASSQVSEDIKKAVGVYDNLLWAGRELATDAASARCVAGFSNLMVPKLILNSNVPRDAVVAELEHFVTKLPVKSALVTATGDDFAALSKKFSHIDALIDANTRGAAKLDPEIVAATSKLSESESDLKEAKKELDDLIPSLIHFLRIDDASKTLTDILTLCTKVIINLLNKGIPEGSEEKKKLDDARNKVDALERQVKTERQALNKIIAESKKAAADDTKWVGLRARLTENVNEVQKVEPSFEVLVRVSGMIKRECETYVEFLKGSDAEDEGKKAAANAKVTFAADLYRNLIPALTKFATAVA